MEDSDGAEEREPVGAEESQEFLDPDALYNEGMAHYRGRRWREAKECFTRLNTLQPSRRVEALLRELEIFLQLEPVEGQTAADATITDVPPPSTPRQQGDLESPSRGGRRGQTLRVFEFFLVIAGLALILRLCGGPLPSSLVSRDQRVKNLRNLGEAYMVAQQYCKALRIYAELLQLVPQDPEAINGVEKAKAKLYDEASAHRKANELEQALEDLRCIFERDPGYKDVLSLIQMLERRQTEEARPWKELPPRLNPR